MKVVQIITRSDSIGGAYVHVRDVSEALVKAGHEVTVLVGSGSHVTEFDSRGIPYRSIPSLVREISPVTDLKALGEIKRALRDIRPDVVATHSSKAGLVGRMAAKSLGIPSTFTAHGWAFAEGVPDRSRKLYASIERFAAKRCSLIFTVSEADRQLALRNHVGTEAQLVTIHNGMPDIEPGLRANPGTSPPKIVMVARFEEQKDQPTLLRALAKLRDLEWSLELIGDGPKRQTCEELAKELHIAERVEFCGARPDVPARLAGAQIFALVSNWEGFPLSTLEAMRAGLPVVVSDVGGSAEAIVPGKTGMTVPRGDADAVAGALRELIADPSKRIAMGAEARRHYEDRFSFNAMFEKIVGAYRSLV